MIAWRGVRAAGRPGDGDEDLPPLRPPERPPSGWRLALEVPVLLVVAAVIALLVKAFLAQAFYIPSESMEPQLTAGDRVVVSRLAYRMHEPRRGDIVVFDDPLAPDEDDGELLPVRVGREALEALGVIKPREKELIKRVVGLPGETISAEDGVIHVNGRPLTEPYLGDAVGTGTFGPVVVPDGHLFMMGDNRGNSKDSRRFGPVDQDLVVGRAIVLVWPPGRVAFL